MLPISETSAYVHYVEHRLRIRGRRDGQRDRLHHAESHRRHQRVGGIDELVERIAEKRLKTPAIIRWLFA